MTDTIIDTNQLAAHHYQCHHIFPDGARCGSPALRNENRCYYHHETRKPVSNPRHHNARLNTFEMPFPDNRTTIQASLGEIFTRIATNNIDSRRAGLLLYCLQIATTNLKASQQAQAKTTTAPTQEPTLTDEIEPIPISEPFAHEDTQTHKDPEKGAPIRRETFAVLLEQLAKHKGIDIEHPAYSPISLTDSAILANLRAAAE